MQREWEAFWNPFLDAKKLRSKVEEINKIDQCNKTESICREIFDEYEAYSKRLNDVRLKFVQEVEHLPGVHLQTSRVKSVESIIEKVVTKRYEKLLDKRSLYSKISGENYKEILTDLVGVRLIISYRGEWTHLHNEIVKKFPYRDEKDYKTDFFIPHEDGKQFIAEIPKAYFAYGDDIGIYSDMLIKPQMKESGYRSVHYVISFMETYIELQTRTIYDEAWSDCDHNYVYKHEDNRSHAFLKRLSGVLCDFTNTSNDLGDIMQKLFDEKSIVGLEDGSFVTSDMELVDRLDELLKHYKKAQIEFEELRKRIVINMGG